MRPTVPLLARLSVVWGSADRIAARPDLDVHDNAVYLPAAAGPPLRP